MKKLLNPTISIIWLAAVLISSGSAASTDWLVSGFQDPPASARPWVYWFPLNGNLTKAGITADLEAMARVGIGGALYMEVDQGEPKGEADFAGPLWMEMITHACNEAKRLGIEINMNNDAGWSGSSGPWITPAMSMQEVVWSEVVVDQAASNVVLAQPEAKKGFYQDIAVLAMPAPAVDARIPDIGDKASFRNAKRMSPQSQPMPAVIQESPPGSTIPRNQIIDLTRQMDRNGKLTWDVPAGKWLVMRFGHTTTDVVNAQAPLPGRGLECDKLSKEAAAFHFEHLMGRIIQKNRTLTGPGKALVGVHIDSWEVGAQNWTPKMQREFRKRRGYDLLPFLPAFSGRIIDSSEVTERFLWDLRQTISELQVENYAGTFRDLAHRHGLRLSIEAYDGPSDNLSYAGQADEPMGEFWVWSGFGRYGRSFNCTEMASAGHTYGKRIIGAEAFTSDHNERWQGHPADIKDIGDWAFCEGINRFVFHRYAAQPFIKATPGMSMGPWGLHYERTQTWWEQSKAWHRYLARCQFILQQGLFVADIAYLTPEGAPRAFVAPPEAEIVPHVRSGYGFDGCSPEVVLTRMSVKESRLVLPDGMSYRTLVLPDVETMTPALLAKIQRLADAGAMVVGPAAPPRKSPSLADMGAGDEKLRNAAAVLWSSGKILTGKTAQQFLAERGVSPDFEAFPILRHIHRKIGDTDVYFIANPHPRGVDAVAGFRVTGKQPELWWPDSGRVESQVAFREQDGVTRVPVHLERSGSVFVFFREPSADIDPVVALQHDGSVIWSLDKSTHPIRIIKATYGVPGDALRTRDVTQKLQLIVDAGREDARVADLAKGDDPAFGVVKTLSFEYSVDGQTRTAAGQDPELLSMIVSNSAEPSAELRGGEHGGSMILSAREMGCYNLQMASGITKTVQVSAIPAVREITGPWSVRFDPAAGGPGDVTFSKLEDWSKRSEDGIRYYSGTAVYQTTFESPPAAENTIWMLDLGGVEVMTEVHVNGKNLGIAWKYPYRIDITSALKPGENRLELNVVNLWINRQIGDENLPEDSDRNPNGSLKLWPDWVLQEKPSPTGRISFTSRRLWRKNDRLRPSGLLGPVRLIPVVQVPVQ